MTVPSYRPRVGLGALLTILGVAASPAPAEEAPQLDGVPAELVWHAPRVKVPMGEHHRIPTVEVTIDGRGPYRLFLDTGAGATVLDDDLADELGLAVVGTTRIGDPADPEGIAAEQRAVGRLEIGGLELRRFHAVSWERSGLRPAEPGVERPRGVLGLPLFGEVMATLDYPARRLVLERGELPPADGREVLDFEIGEAGSLLAVPIEVAGRRIEATLDSGSGGDLSFPTSFTSELPLVAPPTVVGKGRMVGGEVTILGAELAGDVLLGGHRFVRPRVRFNDRLRHVNLGSGILGRYAVTIDRGNRRIRFREPAASPAVAPEPAAPGSGATAGYSGRYGAGEREVTVEGPAVRLQRLRGPHGAGPRLELVAAGPDAFALPGESAAKIRFVRDVSGSVVAIEVLTPGGEWERAPKDP